MGVLIELRSRQSLQVVGDGVNLLIRATDGEDASNSVVGGVSLYNHQNVRNPMGQDRSRGESLLEFAEGGATGVIEVPWSVFVGEMG